MATTGKRLAGPALVTNAAATKYTAPAATVTKVQNIHVQNPSNSVVTFTLSIGADAAGTRLFDALPIQPLSAFDSFGPFYLAAGEIIQAFAGTTNVLTLTIDGTETT